MDSIRVSEALDSGSIPDGATTSLQVHVAELISITLTNHFNVISYRFKIILPDFGSGSIAYSKQI
jgi:hypothetical protein